MVEGATTSNGIGALAGLKILDLSNFRGQLCGRLLADMGADVIKVEPPGGDEARGIGPFLDDLAHRDRSLFFWFYNLNKRSITLDLRLRAESGCCCNWRAVPT